MIIAWKDPPTLFCFLHLGYTLAAGPWGLCRSIAGWSQCPLLPPNVLRTSGRCREGRKKRETAFMAVLIIDILITPLSTWKGDQLLWHITAQLKSTLPTTATFTLFVSANSCSSYKWREWCLNSISYSLQLLKSLHINRTLYAASMGKRQGTAPGTDCTQQLTLIPTGCSPLTLTYPSTAYRHLIFSKKIRIKHSLPAHMKAGCSSCISSTQTPALLLFAQPPAFRPECEAATDDLLNP